MNFINKMLLTFLILFSLSLNLAMEENNNDINPLDYLLQVAEYQIEQEKLHKQYLKELNYSTDFSEKYLNKKKDILKLRNIERSFDTFHEYDEKYILFYQTVLRKYANKFISSIKYKKARVALDNLNDNLQKNEKEKYQYIVSTASMIAITMYLAKKKILSKA